MGSFIITVLLINIFKALALYVDFKKFPILFAMIGALFSVAASIMFLVWR